MSTVFKKFSKSDISIIPFSAHKQSTFNSASLLNNRGNFYSASFPTIAYKNGSNFEWANSGSENDINNHKKYFQLDHLFYRNSKLDYVNKFSTVKYFDHYRVLYDNVNILSLPYKTIGYKIKTESFSLVQDSPKLGRTVNIKDDGKGNLYDTTYGTITSVTDTTDFKNEKFRIFYLGPEKGYKYYNLNLVDGREIVNYQDTFTEDRLLDNSFLFNNIEYKNVAFSSKNLDDGNYPVIDFISGRSSKIKSPHNSLYNFNNDNFAISFFVSSSEIQNNNLKKYLVSKSTTKTIIPTPNPLNNTINSGSSTSREVFSEPQYPFEIYYQSQSIHFSRFDGGVTSEVSTIATSSDDNMLHVVCQKVSSNLEIYINGTKLGTALDETSQTQNQANLYIGSKGGKNSFFTGSMTQIMMFDDHLSQTQINNLSQSIDNKPYVGNIFYNNGLVAITKPNYQDMLNPGNSNDFTLQYKGTHLIYENEYQCMVDQHEFDVTLNPSARKVKSKDSEDLANFATGSYFRPYVTTIGLYNDNGELLVVGKLGQAIRMSDETDTTYVVRFDT